LSLAARIRYGLDYIALEGLNLTIDPIRKQLVPAGAVTTATATPELGGVMLGVPSGAGAG